MKPVAVQWRTRPIRFCGVRGRRLENSDYVGVDPRTEYSRVNRGGGMVMDWYGLKQVKSGCGLQ